MKDIHQIRKTLSQLSKLNLSDYPRNEIYSLLSELGEFGIVIVTFHPGKPIFRARPNTDNERFYNVNELSYKPKELNHEYQRASIPQKTMFYGSTISDSIQVNELNNARVIVVFEAMPWMRDKSTSGYKKITFTKWIVNQDINLVAVVGKKDFYPKNTYLKELADGFDTLKESQPERSESIDIVNEFLANEFAKKETGQDYEYMVSAIFTEIMIQKGFDGVIYPSTRMDGQGFNIAIKPETADRALTFELAGECSLYKHLDKSTLDNDNNGFASHGLITYQPITDKDQHAGSEVCLKIIGIGSMEDLLAIQKGV